MDKRRILIVAGSDSSGGAGLEADQKVIAAHGCYAMTATTALTVQNTQGVYDIHYIPSDFVRKQIEACFDDIGVDVVKIGMLASAETTRVVADVFKKYTVSLSVVDPVMVSTSGTKLLPNDAVRSLREELLPRTTILTPNIPEACLLLENAGLPSKQIRSAKDLIELAKQLQKLGPQYVLLKGGHLPLDHDHNVPENRNNNKVVVDILQSSEETLIFENKFIDSKNTHGTGCSLASAIAANIASGLAVAEAVKSASHYIEAAIKTSPSLGRGNGPINHFHSSYHLPFAPGRFIPYILARKDVTQVWEDHTKHEFVAKLADGSLPVASFKYYLIQDYLYLVQFARANALAAYKAKNIDDIKTSASIVTHIHHEMQLHLDYCKEFGLSKDDIEKYTESQACTAYTRYVLDIGQSEDFLALQISLAPCMLGYGIIARRLYDDPKTLRDGNIYWKWIESYVDKDYLEAVEKGSDLIERHAVLQSTSRIEELVQIFIQATKMETGFWDMGSGTST